MLVSYKLIFNAVFFYALFKNVHVEITERKTEKML